MDPDKTRHGLLIGGNAGVTAEEAYRTMLDTKEYFGKLEGRQGYHFIISFAPGETDPETAMSIAMEFCDTYLRDYESCYSVHEDKEHIHAHICFNSIDAVEGKKYHYVDGQWKHEIQPLVDELCIKHGLKPLTYESNKPRLNKSYDKWEAEKQKPAIYDNRKDIDAAIMLAKDYEDFLQILGRKYQIRTGYSRKWNSEYFTMKGPGMQKGRRNYSLGKLYTVESIKARITLKQENVPLPVLPLERSIRLQVDRIHQAPWKQNHPMSRQAKYYMSFYWRMKKAMKELFPKDRKAFRELEQMIEDLEFCLRNGIHTRLDQEQRELAWRLQLKALQQEEQELLHIHEQHSEQSSDQETEHQQTIRQLQQEAKQMKKQLAQLKKQKPKE